MFNVHTLELLSPDSRGEFPSSYWSLCMAQLSVWSERFNCGVLLVTRLVGRTKAQHTHIKKCGLGI